ncbi:MAG TPA: CAP domain-containing protein [Nocardioidaceae bacterium]|nr:CAP domain-containing protein [Nocardioidaceae bacterium]
MRRVLGALLTAFLVGSTLTVPAPAYASGTVTGVVVDEDGRPVNSLDVYGLPRAAKTSASGKFSVASVPNGTYTLSFFDNDWQQFFYDQRLTVSVSGLSGKNLGMIVLPSSPNRNRSSAAIDTGSREAVRTAYRRGLVPTILNERNLIPSGCRVEATPLDQQQRTIRAANFMRRISGLDPVSLDRTLSAKAQKAALIQYHQGYLSHAPSAGARCYTQEGGEASGRSNLAQGFEGARTVVAYMNDRGDGNTSAGHRRWIVDPYTETMGHGQVAGYEALFVNSVFSRSNPAPRHLSWPPAGWFPKQLEPRRRWSFSVVRKDVSFAGATVSVRRGTKPLAVRTYRPQSGYGDQQTLVWDLAKRLRVRTAAVVTVTVSGITQRGYALPSYTYVVRLFSA